MEKKMFGIILTILGIAGLVAAAINFVSSKAGDTNIKLVSTFAVLGAIFFFTGVGLLNNTKDKSV